MNSGILTIDDIASKNTPAIVDYLNEKGICAILFAVGQNIEKYYDEAIYAIKKGMIIGNHSYTHQAFSALSLETCIEEIERCENIINKLYSDAGVRRCDRSSSGVIICSLFAAISSIRSRSISNLLIFDKVSRYFPVQIRI